MSVCALQIWKTVPTRSYRLLFPTLKANWNTSTWKKIAAIWKRPSLAIGAIRANTSCLAEDILSVSLINWMADKSDKVWTKYFSECWSQQHYELAVHSEGLRHRPRDVRQKQVRGPRSHGARLSTHPQGFNLLWRWSYLKVWPCIFCTWKKTV